jgi:hypothetical protein
VRCALDAVDLHREHHAKGEASRRDDLLAQDAGEARQSGQAWIAPLSLSAEPPADERSGLRAFCPSPAIEAPKIAATADLSPADRERLHFGLGSTSAPRVPVQRHLREITGRPITASKCAILRTPEAMLLTAETELRAWKNMNCLVSSRHSADARVSSDGAGWPS